MAKKLTNIPGIAGDRIVAINKADIKYEKPVVSITYLCSNKYCLKHLAKVHMKRRGTRNVFQELYDFIKGFRQFEDVNSACKYYMGASPKNKDCEISEELKRIESECNIDTSSPCHLHCKPHGKSEFVLHGFVVANRFEIVFIDPEHELHS